MTTSNERINRIHRMAQYSFASNTMSIFTDCPGREKQSYPADYTMVMGAIERNHELASYLRGHMRHFAEGQSIADTFMRGNVALKVPVHDWGFAGQFGDEINWGNGIILVPAFLYELYGDTDTMATYYDEMVFFHDYIVREQAGAGALPDHIVNAALSDWVSAEQTSGQITGTWGYFVMTEKLAMMAELTGHDADAAKYAELAEDIKAAFNAQFYNTTLKRYAADGGAAARPGLPRSRRRSPSTPASCRTPIARPSSTISSRTSTPSTPPGTVGRTCPAARSVSPRPSGRSPTAAAVTSSGMCSSRMRSPATGSSSSRRPRTPAGSRRSGSSGTAGRRGTT